MTLRINGSTSGYTEIDAPAVAGSNTITLPTGNGSANQLLKNGATAGSLEFASNVVIDSSGKLLVGTSSAIQGETGLGVSAAQTGGGSAVVTFRNSSTSSADNSPVLMCRKAMSTTSSSARFIQFSANEDSEPMGYIGGNGANNVQFVSTSDIREKENIEPFAGALSKIMALEVVSFDWKKSKEHVNAGFIAQNVETVMPEYVVENTSGGIKEPRKGITGGMSAGYVAVLTAALQEAVSKIETLEAKVAALESA